MRTSPDDFIERSKAVHGTKDDYSKVHYYTTETKVIIICPKHGEFLMRPRAHYQDMRGCPDCDKGEKSGFSDNSKWATERIKYFYIIEAYGNGERFIKFGLTTEALIKRFQKGQFPYEYTILFEYKLRGGLDIEDRFIEKYKRMKYRPRKSFRGDTECFEFGLKGHVIKDTKDYFSK